MLQSVKKLIGVLLLAAGATQAEAFSLGGPLDTWQTTTLGYSLTATDLAGPMNLGEEYRWNTPTIVYAFDSSFLDYFGQDGVEAVEAAIKILNDLPGFSKMSLDLSEFPLDTRRFNYQATALGIRDMKSWTLSLMLEALGLGVPERWAYTLRATTIVNGSLVSATTLRRNFDPVTLLPSSYINGTLYTYSIVPISPTPDFEAIEVTVDPLAPSVTSVVALGGMLAGEGSGGSTDFRGAGVLLNPGLFYTGLTRDDVGGLKYIYNKNNFNVENVSSNAVSALGAAGGGGIPWLPVPGSGGAGAGTAPGGGAGGIGGGGVGGATTNALVDLAPRPGPDKITFVRANFDSTLSTVFTNTVTFTDVYLTNGVVRQQLVQRILTAPDILFSAADLGLVGDLPILINRTVTYQNNTAQNSTGGTPLSGPGIINPQVEIAFSKVGPFLRNFGGTGLREEAAIRGQAWGSFDGSTNAPIVFPRGTSIRELERIVLEESGGTPWRLVTGP